MATGASLLYDGVQGFIVCSSFRPAIGGGDDGGQMVAATVTDENRVAPRMIHSCLVRWCIGLIDRHWSIVI